MNRYTNLLWFQKQDETHSLPLSNPPTDMDSELLIKLVKGAVTAIMTRLQSKLFVIDDLKRPSLMPSSCFINPCTKHAKADDRVLRRQSCKMQNTAARHPTSTAS